LGQSVIEIQCVQPLPEGVFPFWADATQTQVGQDRRTLSVTSTRLARTLVDVVKWIDQQGIDLSDIHLTRPSLEDVFIELTGKSLRE
jgi:ABC-2 type transport system ATP-binding protein